MNYRNESGIRIITMHSSKGLEYLNVWIPDVYEGNIPIRQAKTEDEIEEERRLFYVAVTRAKKCLTIYGMGQNLSISKLKKHLLEYFGFSEHKKTEQHTLSQFFREIK